MAAIENEIDMDIQGWLIELPFELARHGFVDEAVTVAARYSEVIEADNFLADRAIILAEAGRREDALAQLTENLLRFPEDAWVIIKSGDVYDVLQENEQAERLYRLGIEIAGDDQYARDGAMERLIPLLDDAGKNDEVDSLIDAEEKRRWNRQKSSMTLFGETMGEQSILLPGDTADDFYGEDNDANRFPEPYMRPSPKIGRNAPCPCGSGKKYKKCCAGNEPD
jgi:tetratricopeptide (TPR) repeat protein